MGYPLSTIMCARPMNSAEIAMIKQLIGVYMMLLIPIVSFVSAGHSALRPWVCRGFVSPLFDGRRRPAPVTRVVFPILFTL